MQHGTSLASLPNALGHSGLSLRDGLSVNITDLPECALACITAVCEATNSTCICSHEGYQSDMGDCMFNACDQTSALFSRNLTLTHCEFPVRNRDVEFIVPSVILSLVAGAFVATRFVHNKYFSTKTRLTWDDWMITSGSFSGLIPLAIEIFLLLPNGLGRDQWALDKSQLLKFGHYFYGVEICYLFLISLLKISITLFYISIFPGGRIHRLLWGTVWFHLATGVAFIFKTIFQCSPVDYNWLRFTPDSGMDGHCININASAWANGVICVLGDIWLLALPLSQISKLHLPWKKKLGAYAMFLTGAIVTLVSILRLASIATFANSRNPTWDNWSLVFWSTMEVSIGFMCCTLPTLRLVLKRFFPRVFNTEVSKSGVSRTRMSGLDLDHRLHDTRDEISMDPEACDVHDHDCLNYSHSPTARHHIDDR